MVKKDCLYYESNSCVCFNDNLEDEDCIKCKNYVKVHKLSEK